MVGLRAVRTRPRVHAVMRAYVIVLEEGRRGSGVLLHGVLGLQSRSVLPLHHLHMASLRNKW